MKLNAAYNNNNSTYCFYKCIKCHRNCFNSLDMTEVQTYGTSISYFKNIYKYMKFS